MSGGMAADDANLCRNVVKTLTSDRYKDKNYLFLLPFDLSQTPGYMDVVEKVMDLSTLSQNLEAGQYPTRQAFFKDCFVIFENAIAYHNNRDSKWIAKLAKEMLKVAKREEKNVNKKHQADASKKSVASKKEGNAAKLKLKIGGPSNSTDDVSSTSKTKMSIKLKSPSQGNQNKKPRLTLKIGKPKTPTAEDDDSTSKSASSGNGKISIKMSGGGGGSRGKELPKGVAPPKSNKKTASKKNLPKNKKTKITLKASAPGASRGTMQMTSTRKAQCLKVLSGLKRRKYKDVGWFLQPISEKNKEYDKNFIKQYRSRIKHPMDLSTMQAKLERNQYSTIAAFVLDLRRIFSNCLRFNTSIKDKLRPVAVSTLKTAEELCTVFLAKPESPTVAYTPLLYCWVLCISILDQLYNLTDEESGQPIAFYFLHPVPCYTGGQYPEGYLEKIKKPMDFGTVTQHLIEGKYTSLDEFELDCQLVLDNCITYYGGSPDGKVFADQAERLKAALLPQLEKLKRYIKSPAGTTLRNQSTLAVTTTYLQKPQIHLLLNIIAELRALNYTDKATMITEPAMAHFEKPVSLAAFPDYAQHVQFPMDLQTVERKTKSASYGTPEDFEFDCLLIFQNCVTYNSARQTDHLVAMGKYAIKQFRRIFTATMKAIDDPSSVSSSQTPHEYVRKAPPAGAAQQGPSKKQKLDPSEVSRGKTAFRISLTSSQVSSAAEKAVQAPRPRTPKNTVPKSKPNQPVPLHIAIAQVKEQFPLRRAVKSLQSWEAGCARYFKELMRHSWISAARPKFIFHVPVPVLFPELHEAYAAKIKKPMDLTTVECTLLAGNRYTSPEDFVNDIALVFANAITFNKDGRDVGDPLSCAYYDASIHLLRYCRWLSHEVLPDYVKNSDHVDEPEEMGVLTSWELTVGNRNKAREEMEAIVLKEPIEKSLEGDRYTWMEAECEKLLKALRHQSDLRYMTFFIQPNYPADYAAFIAKPMDWERCQKTLKKRQYDTFGDVIADLRLIFSNALKYNARHAGTDTVSGKAYDAAKYMSAKLETAINKMMLTVSDRIERERIDHNNAEREIEAAERAEEERIRAQWKNENSKEEGGGGSLPARIESTQRVRTTTRTIMRESTDFEVPFFDDEDDGHQKRSYFEVVRQQRAMFERQRQDLSKMQQSAAGLGASVFLRMMHRDLALKFVAEEKKKLGLRNPPQATSTEKDSSKQNSGDSKESSSVLAKLDEKGRNPFQLKLLKPKAKTKKKRKLAQLNFDE